MKKELMSLAGEIAKKDPAFEQRMLDLFKELFQDLNAAMDDRDQGSEEK